MNHAPLDDSFYLANPLLVCGFPKSGNTWIGYSLSHYFNAKYLDAYKEEARLDPGYPVDRQRPVMYNEDGFLGQHDRPGQARVFTSIVKSHHHPRQFAEKHPRFLSGPRPFAALPVLIIREPKDVAVSYFFYNYFYLPLVDGWPPSRIPAPLRAYVKKARYFSRFVLEIAAQWRDYHRQWQDTPHLVVKYEDLRRAPFETTARLIRELGQVVDEAQLRATVDFCEFETLRRIETKYLNVSSRHESFFREGRCGGWVKHFISRQSLQFDEILGSIRDETGYGDIPSVKPLKPFGSDA